MAYVKIEPSGCCERKGMVQVRLAMYLEDGDYGYEKHHVDVPIIPESGYKGKKSDTGLPVDMEDYRAWIKTLPTQVQDNPFHNHFICVEPETSEEEIMDIAEAFLHEAYIKWACEKPIDLNNDSLSLHFPAHVSPERIGDCVVSSRSIGSINKKRFI